MMGSAIKIIIYIAVTLSVSAWTGCSSPIEPSANPWLVPFSSRNTSAISRDQMYAMKRLGETYRDAGMQEEYVKALTTSVELYAGNQSVTFDLLNILIEDINESREELSERKAWLEFSNVDPDSVSEDNLPEDQGARELALAYLLKKKELNEKYENGFRIMSVACTQIPYNAELYYRTASLQWIRAEETGDRDLYKGAIEYLKRSIASDSGHLESYHLIALSYEAIGDYDRASRFWRLFEVVYEIGPDVLGENFITASRRQLHEDAIVRLDELAELGYE